MHVSHSAAALALVGLVAATPMPVPDGRGPSEEPKLRGYTMFRTSDGKQVRYAKLDNSDGAYIATADTMWNQGARPDRFIIDSTADGTMYGVGPGIPRGRAVASYYASLIRSKDHAGFSPIVFAPGQGGQVQVGGKDNNPSTRPEKIFRTKSGKLNGETAPVLLAGGLESRFAFCVYQGHRVLSLLEPRDDGVLGDVPSQCQQEINGIKLQVVGK